MRGLSLLRQIAACVLLLLSLHAKEFLFIKPITVIGKGGDLTVRMLSERRAGKISGRRLQWDGEWRHIL